MTDVLAKALRGVGQTLITLGLVILLFCVYELYFTGLETAKEQKRGKEVLLQEWAAPVPSPSAAASAAPTVRAVTLGDGIAILRIPRLGRDYGKVVFEGVRTSDLKRGPGHYPRTAMPGEIGNFVVSGHRTTYGAPFGRLDELVPGDLLVVETRDRWFTYRLVGEEIVSPDDVAVILPVPRQPKARPSKALMTLTTCHPKYSAKQRLISYAELVATDPKASGTVPDALKG
ncbi:MAG TPA: class E sortase [Mycobacteriales bacterium]|nr:class E sortase [Mycobacteriales bacterium]